MEAEDKQILQEIIHEIDRLLEQKDHYGIKNIPSEISGLTADMLYERKINNKSLVLVIEGYIVFLKGKKDAEIIARMQDLSTSLKKTLLSLV